MAGNDAVPTSEQLQDLLLASPDFTEFLLGLATISASLLARNKPMLCAITVEQDGSPTTVASSGDEARRLDEKQYASNDGPCLTALREQHPVLVADLQSDERWSDYARAVSGDGILSVFAVPITTDEPARAALNCYADVPGAFDAATVDAVQQQAAAISRILRLAMRIHVPGPYPEHLRSALKSRAIVDAAVALIMVQNRCGRDRAMEILRLAAQTNARKIHDIASDIIRQADPGGG